MLARNPIPSRPIHVSLLPLALHSLSHSRSLVRSPSRYHISRLTAETRGKGGAQRPIKRDVACRPIVSYASPLSAPFFLSLFVFQLTLLLSPPVLPPDARRRRADVRIPGRRARQDARCRSLSRPAVESRSRGTGRGKICTREWITF